MSQRFCSPRKPPTSREPICWSMAGLCPGPDGTKFQLLPSYANQIVPFQSIEPAYYHGGLGRDPKSNPGSTGVFQGYFNDRQDLPSRSGGLSYSRRRDVPRGAMTACERFRGRPPGCGECLSQTPFHPKAFPLSFSRTQCSHPPWHYGWARRSEAGTNPHCHVTASSAVPPAA